MDVSIREANLEDLDGIYQVDLLSFPQPMSKASIDRDLRDTRLARYYVACLEETVIGYIGLWCIFPEAHIISIAVAPQYRRMGVGRSLMKRALTDLTKGRYEHVFLEVRVDNEPAQRMYEKFGFTKVSIRRGYYQDGTDAIVMVKDLLKDAE
ncbi:ribosomal protein S18-alanine N-acetyltransferase [Coprothermobacteraceae bacterium]|nr:ribosomal protein S18-alanine N-acetyltransferase [Coprothermobacteraceae bacterium]